MSDRRISRRLGGDMRRPAALVLAILGVVALVLGRGDESHFIDAAGVGCGALAIFLLRAARPRRWWDALLLWGGAVLVIPLAAALALALFVNVVMGGCVYGSYEPGQCGHFDPFPAPARITLAARDSGRMLDLHVGDVFAVDLDELGSAGYQWVIDPGSAPYLELVGRGTIGTVEPSGHVGASTTREFRFRAATPGMATLRLSERHPWESGGTAAQTFVVIVRILQ